MNWQGYADFIIEKGKGLLSHENKPFCVPFGGDKRDRTADLLNAIQALSQLSYTPIFRPMRNVLKYSKRPPVCQPFFSNLLTFFMQSNISVKDPLYTGSAFMV